MVSGISLRHNLIDRNLTFFFVQNGCYLLKEKRLLSYLSPLFLELKLLGIMGGTLSTWKLFAKRKRSSLISLSLYFFSFCTGCLNAAANWELIRTLSKLRKLLAKTTGALLLGSTGEDYSQNESNLQKKISLSISLFHIPFTLIFGWCSCLRGASSNRKFQKKEEICLSLSLFCSFPW